MLKLLMHIIEFLLGQFNLKSATCLPLDISLNRIYIINKSIKSADSNTAATLFVSKM